MTQVIRWPGLIAFFLLCALFSVIFFLFLDLWIKLAVIETLEKTTGAEVNIASVSHTFAPFGVSLTGLQITDPKQPSHNQVQAEQIHAQISLPPLLLRKVIIETLTMSQLRFAQQRVSVGEVYRQPIKINAETFSKLLPSQPTLPSVDEILAKSPLKTTKAVEEIQHLYQQKNQQLTQQYQELPDKSKLETYQKRIKALTSTDYKDLTKLAGAKKEFDQLQYELKQEQQKFSDFNLATTEAKEALSAKLKQLQAAPGQDYDQLKALVAGDSAAINEVTSLVFGDKASLWSQYLFSAYQIAAPLLSKKKEEQQQQLARSQGRWLEFSDTQALPDLLIKTAEISLNWQNENIVSHWQNITGEHDKIGQATLFTVDSTNSKLWQSLSVEGDFWLKDKGMKASQNWDLQGLALADLSLLDEKKLSGVIDKALMNSRGAITVNENVIHGDGKIELSKLMMSAKGSNKLTKLIATTLTQLNSLSIGTTIKGPLDKPELNFTSDLDKKLTSAMLTNLSGDQQGKLQALKQKLAAKIQSPLADSNTQMSQWLNWEKLSGDSQSQVKEMLATQFSNQLDQQKDKLINIFKNKFSGG